MRQQFGSLERYGAGGGAFLTPLYGCGELPQAFCRSALGPARIGYFVDGSRCRHQDIHGGCPLCAFPQKPPVLAALRSRAAVLYKVIP